MHGDGLNPRSPDELDAMLLRAAELLEERHVVAETGRRGVGMLRTAVAQQRYREHAEAPVALADALTSDLRLASGDNHLFVEHLGDEGTPADDWIERWRQEGPSRNWGISAVRLLPGNIGYLKLTSFYTYALAVDTLRAAMELVRHSDGLVLDLTDNGGGDDETANAVMDTFLDLDTPRPLLLESREGREPPRPPTDLAWPHYGIERPLAILIDRRTFSAPEAVAYALQQERRGRRRESQRRRGEHDGRRPSTPGGVSDRHPQPPARRSPDRHQLGGGRGPAGRDRARRRSTLASLGDDSPAPGGKAP